MTNLHCNFDFGLQLTSLMLYAWIGEIILALLFNFHPKYVFLWFYESVQGRWYFFQQIWGQPMFFEVQLSYPLLLPASSISQVACTLVGSLEILPLIFILKFYRGFEPIVSSVWSVSFFIFFLWILWVFWLVTCLLCVGFFPAMRLLTFFDKDYLEKKTYFIVFLLLLS